MARMRKDDMIRCLVRIGQFKNITAGRAMSVGDVETIYAMHRREIEGPQEPEPVREVVVARHPRTPAQQRTGPRGLSSKAKTRRELLEIWKRRRKNNQRKRRRQRAR